MHEQAWPSELNRDGDGRLRFDDCALDEMLEIYGSPLWVCSRSQLASNFRKFHDAFASLGNCDVAYAMKANNSQAIVRVLANEGALIDASAEHEFRLALNAGVPSGRIILNGNGKSTEALESAARLGVCQVNIDSLAEARRLHEIARGLGRKVSCAVRLQLSYRELLRLNPSFETTLRIGEGKFGCHVESGVAMDVARFIHESEHLDLVGVSHHVGFSGYMADYSAEREVMHHRECAREIVAWVNSMESELGARLDRIDLGGGFRSGDTVTISVPGGQEQPRELPLPDVGDYVEAIRDGIDGVDLGRVRLQFEAGGFFVSDAVALLTTVAEVKPVTGRPLGRYVSVDSSMMMFVSRGMMRVGHPITTVGASRGAVDGNPLADIVGQTCVYDSIAECVPMPELEPGDAIAVLNQGAYCEAQSTQFNAFPRPAAVLVDRGRHALVKRRETLSDICGRETVPVYLLAPNDGSRSDLVPA